MIALAALVIALGGIRYLVTGPNRPKQHRMLPEREASVESEKV